MSLSLSWCLKMIINLGYPPACKVDRVVYKKMFHDAGGLSKADRALLTDGAEKILWAYNLRRGNTMIVPYQDEVRKYEEIQVMQVLLKHPKGLRRLAEIIMRTIPYPMLLWFEHQGKCAAALAHQRTSLADSDKNTLEEIWMTDFLPPDNSLFSLLHHSKQRFTHFFDYYSDLVDALCKGLARQAGAAMDMTGDEARSLLHRLTNLEGCMASWRAELKKESRFNRQMELNIKIKKLESKKQQLLTATGGQT